MLKNLEKCYKIQENPRQFRKMLGNLEKCYKILKNDTTTRKVDENGWKWMKLE